MIYHTPITGEELEAMKRRARCWTEGGYVTPAGLPAEKPCELMIRVASDVLRHAPGDLDRCLAEIERLHAENDGLRNETARIILLAEEHPDPDGLTFTLKFTKELLAELRALLA